MPDGARRRHGCCEIDEYRMIIVGGCNTTEAFSDGFIYDARTEQFMRPLNDMPAAIANFHAVANKQYMFVIGGSNEEGAVNTMHWLSLEPYKWTTMMSMGNARAGYAGALCGN